MNERVSERVEDVPVRKFQDGDKVVFKERMREHPKVGSLIIVAWMNGLASP